MNGRIEILNSIIRLFLCRFLFVVNHVDSEFFVDELEEMAETLVLTCRNKIEIVTLINPRFLINFCTGAKFIEVVFEGVMRRFLISNEICFKVDKVVEFCVGWFFAKLHTLHINKPYIFQILSSQLELVLVEDY